MMSWKTNINLLSQTNKHVHIMFVKRGRPQKRAKKKIIYF